MTQSESKYFATAIKMDQALLALLEKKEFDYITVKEICAAAGVHRSTFYLHYETVGDLLTECTAYMNRQFLDHMQTSTATFIEGIQSCTTAELYLVTPAYLLPYLNFILENRRLFRTAVEKAAVLGAVDAYKQMYQYIFTPILQRFGVPENERVYIIDFYIHGIMAVITHWLQQDCADSVEQIAAIIQKCVPVPGEET